jgi:hypothetical protein
VDVIRLSIECAYRPGIRFTDATAFLFDTRRQFPNQNLFSLLGTPDKVIGQFIRDVFGVLPIHTQHYYECSLFRKSHVGPPYPYLKDRGIRRPLHEKEMLTTYSSAVPNPMACEKPV